MRVTGPSVRRWSAAAIVGFALVIASSGRHGAGAQEATFYSGPVAPLTAAVWHGRLNEVRRLLTDGANPNWPDGTPPLTSWQAAVLAGDQPSLDLFARYDATRPASHYTPTLFKAALQRGDARLVAAFIRGRASLTFSDAEYSPLSVAAASGYDDVIQVLLGAGVDVNAQNRFGDTALMAAVRSGRLEAVRLLLDRGADVRRADREGRTAMTWAERTGRQSVIDELHARGAVRSSEAETFRSWPLVPLRTAAARSLVLLQRGGAAWLERSACASCHHQGLLIPVVDVARRQGFPVNEDEATAQEGRLRAMLVSMEPGFQAASEGNVAAIRFNLGFLGQATSGTAWLQAALATTSSRRTSDELIAIRLGRTQLPNGRWRVGAPRPRFRTAISSPRLSSFEYS